MTVEEAINYLSEEGKSVFQHDTDMLQAIDMAIEALKERPQGEWIPSFKDIEYKCSICGRVVDRGAWEDITKEFPYCCCGAKMKQD